MILRHYCGLGHIKQCRDRNQVKLYQSLFLSLPLMNSLPLETLQYIFELACTDGGATGNSLSLTSKQIRAAARRARLHTVRVAVDSDTFPDFVAFCERECNGGRNERPRVRHLYLTLATTPYFPPNPAQISLSPQNRNSQTLPASHEAGQLSNSPAPPLESSGVVSPPPRSCLVKELVRLVAPDLWSLVVYTAPSAFCLPEDLQYPILTHTYPLVREAVFIGLPGPARLNWSDVKPPAFPRATHLYLRPRVNKADLNLPAWSALAPRVTHLHVSDIQMQSHIPQLAEAVGVHAQVRLYRTLTISPEFPPSPRTYPSVRYLFMTPKANPQGRTCGNFSRLQVAMQNGLSDIVQECHRRVDGTVQAVLLKRPDTVPNEQRAKMLGDQWAERVGGGEGWWKGPEVD